MDSPNPLPRTNPVPSTIASGDARALAHNVCQRVLGRYALYGEIAHGGMATVHYGRLLGPVGFSRTVAIKRLHPQYAKDPDFVSMFLDEARVAARIRHPNVVPTLDVVALEGELFLVMEYVQGESLSRLIKSLREANQTPPPPVALSIMSNVLSGLHAAHEATNERGEPLELVHRDMSPQNVIVCIDGAARVLDFGIAKASGRVQTTREGQLKGKLSYIAPEQLQTQPVDRRTDIYAASVTLWETLTGHRLFKGDSEWQIVNQIMSGDLPPPSIHVPGLPRSIDAIVLKGLSRNPDHRYATARDMAMALEQAMPHASARQVGEWVESLAGDALQYRKDVVAEIETSSSVLMAAASSPDRSGERLVNGGTEPISHGDRISGIPQTRTGSGRVLLAEPPSFSASGSSPSAIARNIARGDRPSTASDLRIPAPPRMPSISVATPPSFDTGSAVMSSQRSLAPPPARNRTGVLLLGILVLFGVVGGLLFVVMRQESQPIDPSAAASPTPASLVGMERPVTVALPPSEAVTASANALPSSAPPASASAAKAAAAPAYAAAAPAYAAPRAAPAAPWHPAAPAAAPEPKRAEAEKAPTSSDKSDECSPPYTLDANGIRHPKLECL